MASSHFSRNDSDPDEWGRPKTPPTVSYYATINCVLIGKCEVGKSTFMSRVRGGSWGDEVAKTMTYEKMELVVGTNKGPVLFIVYDCAGDRDRMHKDVRKNEIYRKRDCTILMYNMGKDGNSGMELRDFIKEIKESDEMTAKEKDYSKEKIYKKSLRPVIVVGNQRDCIKVPKRNDSDYNYCKFASQNEMQFFAISCKDDDDPRMLLVPFLELAKMLTKDLHLDFLAHEDPSESARESEAEVLVTKELKVKDKGKLRARGKALKEGSGKKNDETMLGASLEPKKEFQFRRRKYKIAEEEDAQSETKKIKLEKHENELEKSRFGTKAKSVQESESPSCSKDLMPKSSKWNVGHIFGLRSEDGTKGSGTESQKKKPQKGDNNRKKR